MISAESGGTLEAYRETLLRLSPLVHRAVTVVPGHGSPLSNERALEILKQDLTYVDAMIQGGEGVVLAAGRRTAAQKQIHERNLASVALER